MKKIIFLSVLVATLLSGVALTYKSHFSTNQNPPLASNTEYTKELKTQLTKTGDNFNDNMALDNALQAFLTNKEASRSQKAQWVWNQTNTLLQQQQYDTPALAYLLDTLSFLQPIELADTLIEQVNSGTLPPEVSVRLLTALSNAFTMYGNPDFLKLGADTQELITRNKEKIPGLFHQILSTPPNPELLRQAINLFPSVSSPDDYYLLDAAIEQHQDILSIKDTIFSRMSFTFMNGSNIKNNLPAILSSLEKGGYTAEDSQQLSETLIFFTRENLLMAEAGEPDELVMPDATKAELGAFLAKREPTLSDTEYNQNSILSKIAYQEWFITYSLTQTQDKNERIDFINGFLDQSVDIPKKLAIIEGVIASDDAGLLASIKSNPNLQASLTAELERSGLQPDYQEALQQALLMLRR